MKRINAVFILVFYNKSLELVWSLGPVCFAGLVCVLVLMLLLGGGAGVLLGAGVPLQDSCAPWSWRVLGILFVPWGWYAPWGLLIRVV